MNKPPEIIDGAKVLCWAWSGPAPFGVVKSTDGVVAVEIYGLAICQYQGSAKIYRFSCDSEWETEQDSDYDTVQEAKDNLPKQYQNLPVVWVDYVQNT